LSGDPLCDKDLPQIHAQVRRQERVSVRLEAWERAADRPGKRGQRQYYGG
jgi:hypothetical protein